MHFKLNIQWGEYNWIEKGNLGRVFLYSFYFFWATAQISTHFTEHLPYYVTSWELQWKVSGKNMAFKCFQDYGFQWFSCVDLQASKGNSANV